MMSIIVVALSVSAVIGYSVYKLGFHIGRQMGQTQHVRDHLEKTRDQRQTMNPQQIG